MHLSFLEMPGNRKVVYPKFTTSRGNRDNLLRFCLRHEGASQQLSLRTPSLWLAWNGHMCFLTSHQWRELCCSLSGPFLELLASSFLFERHDYAMATCMQEEDIAEQNLNSFWKVEMTTKCVNWGDFRQWFGKLDNGPRMFSWMVVIHVFNIGQYSQCSKCYLCLLGCHGVVS